MSEKVEKLCAELSLSAVAHHYATLADEAVKKKRSYIDYLEQVLSAEAALRGERSRQMLIRLATFPSVKTLEQFDFEAAPGAPKARLQDSPGLPSSSGARTSSCWVRAVPGRRTWRSLLACERRSAATKYASSRRRTWSCSSKRLGERVASSST